MFYYYIYHYYIYYYSYCCYCHCLSLSLVLLLNNCLFYFFLCVLFLCLLAGLCLFQCLISVFAWFACDYMRVFAFVFPCEIVVAFR